MSPPLALRPEARKGLVVTGMSQGHWQALYSKGESDVAAVRARALIVDACAQHPDGGRILDAARLLVSELVTAAFSRGRGPVVLSVAWRGDHLYLAVRADPAPNARAGSPVAAGPEPWSPTARAILDGFADSWTAENCPRGSLTVRCGIRI